MTLFMVVDISLREIRFNDNNRLIITIIIIMITTPFQVKLQKIRSKPDISERTAI